MKNYFLLLCLVTLFSSLIFVSCRKVDLMPGGTGETPEKLVGNEMVMYWNEKTATVLGSPRNQPTRARLFAMVEIAVHDALNSIADKYTRYALFQTPEKKASVAATVASAAYWTIKGLNVQGTFPIDSWYDSSLAIVPEGQAKELGKKIGQQAAEAIISNRANDGFALVIPASVTPADGLEPGAYRSTLIYVGGVLTPTNLKRIPNWGTVVEPFVLTSNEALRPAGPPAVNSVIYTQDYWEVVSKGAKVGSLRNVEEERQARFWSESRPSITWNNFTRAEIKTHRMDAWQTARLFALLHVAMAETINTQLNASYYFYSWRPETAIRLAATDNNAGTEPVDQWLPFLDEVPNVFPTPPVPGYPNGYAAYGGTATEVLRLFFGTDNTTVELSSLTLPGVSLRFQHFSEAAQLNSAAMIYCGWDFRYSVLEGEEMGRDIGKYIFTNCFRRE